MPQIPFYDPQRTYEHNFIEGPFGIFADGKKIKDRGKPKYKFFGQPVYLPFGIAAGPLLNGNYCKAALDHGFDIVVYKTVRTKRLIVHPWPNVLSLNIDGNLTEEKAQKGVVGHHNYKYPLSITNSFGVPSFDPTFWQKDLAETIKYAKPGQVVVGSFQGTVNSEHNRLKYLKDFVLAARLVKETKAKVMEVNLSCPNEGHSNMMCYDIDTTEKIAHSIKNEIGNTPLILKLAYFHDHHHLDDFVKRLGKIADGFAAINTLPARIIDEKGGKALPGDGRDTSGVCGSAIKWAGIDMVGRLAKFRKELGYKYKIVGVGGVMKPRDYSDYMKVGADAVMTATGAMWNPLLAAQIKSK